MLAAASRANCSGKRKPLIQLALPAAVPPAVLFSSGSERWVAPPCWRCADSHIDLSDCGTHDSDIFELSFCKCSAFRWCTNIGDKQGLLCFNALAVQIFVLGHASCAPSIAGTWRLLGRRPCFARRLARERPACDLHEASELTAGAAQGALHGKKKGIVPSFVFLQQVILGGRAPWIGASEEVRISCFSSWGSGWGGEELIGSHVSGILSRAIPPFRKCSETLLSANELEQLPRTDSCWRCVPGCNFLQEVVFERRRMGTRMEMSRFRGSCPRPTNCISGARAAVERRFLLIPMSIEALGEALRRSHLC